MKRLIEKNLVTAPDNASMGDINENTASTQEKKEVIRHNSGISTERITKLSKLILYVIHFCQYKIYITHTTICPNKNPIGILTIH